MAIFGRSIPAESANEKLFIDWLNIEIIKFLIHFYDSVLPM